MIRSVQASLGLTDGKGEESLLESPIEVSQMPSGVTCVWNPTLHAHGHTNETVT